MSEHENETPDAPQEDAGVATTPETETATTGTSGTTDVTLSGVNTETTTSGHTSSVTDLPEGAEVDPLTDQGPQAVQERETHDE